MLRVLAGFLLFARDHSLGYQGVITSMQPSGLVSIGREGGKVLSLLVKLFYLKNQAHYIPDPCRNENERHGNNDHHHRCNSDDDLC